MRSIVEERFTILDTVRKINANDKMPATLSIGVGRDAQSLLQAEKFASQALDMALGRGGDQAAVKNKNGYEFYGGVSKGIEKRTKVKTRIVAAALLELLDSCSNVLLMGHRFADLDALGAAVGLYQPIQQMGKPVKIILNSRANMVKQMHAHLLEQGFGEFFAKTAPGNPLKAEYLLPIYIDELLQEGKVSVKVLPTHDRWFGVTYAEDKQTVVDSFAQLIAGGVYRKDLFSDLKK